MTLIFTIVFGIAILPLFPLAGSGSSSFRLSELLELVLGIVPDNFFTPFLEGNPLQIIFLAVLAGMAMLILGNRAAIVSLFLEQANVIVLLIMENISVFVTVFIFGSLPEKSFSSFFDWSDNSFFCCRIFGEQESVRGKAGD